MAQETVTKGEFWATLKELGESEVRTRIASQRYGPSSWQRALAEQWLAEMESARAEASRSEQIRIARSAKNAAWAAATAAIIAAICATIAIVVNLI